MYDDMTPREALKSRLKTFIDFMDGEDDPEYGRPPYPVESLEKYFKATDDEIYLLLQRAFGYL